MSNFYQSYDAALEYERTCADALTAAKAAHAAAVAAHPRGRRALAGLSIADKQRARRPLHQTASALAVAEDALEGAFQDRCAAYRSGYEAERDYVAYRVGVALQGATRDVRVLGNTQAASQIIQNAVEAARADALAALKG